MRKKHLLHLSSLKGWLFLAMICFSGCSLSQKEQPAPSPAPTLVPSHSPTPKTTPPPAEASTSIYDRIPERTENLKLAIHEINGTVLASGEEFSFNRIVGERTEEKGYQKAIGYDENGDKQPTVGGGICQVSSTIYMAALNGKFEILERHSHSHEVPYADSDHDATVSYHGYDFRFRNNRDKPVKISVSTDGVTVTATITETEY